MEISNCIYSRRKVLITISRSIIALSFINSILYFIMNDKNYLDRSSLKISKDFAPILFDREVQRFPFTLQLAVWNCRALFLASSWRNFRINLINSFINFNELNDRLPRLPRSINPNSCSSLLSTSKEIASGDDLREKKIEYFSVSLSLRIILIFIKIVHERQREREKEREFDDRVK